MIYRFDILFKKTLRNGSVRVVTYRQILDETSIFGEGETLEGAVGELSLVKDGLEKGLSINSLFAKYHLSLTGDLDFDADGNVLPLRFSFSDPADTDSVFAFLADVESSDSCLLTEPMALPEKMEMNLAETASFTMLVANHGSVVVSDEKGETVQLGRGELCLAPANVEKITIASASSEESAGFILIR